MKIAIFSEVYLPYINGVVTHIKTLRDGLTKLGHEVLIVTADTEARHHYIHDGILHCPAKSTIQRFYGYGIASPFSRNRRRLLRAFDPDVIHIHTEFSVGFSGIRAARDLRKPIVYTMHTMYDEYVYYISPRPFVRASTRMAHSYFWSIARTASAITGPSQKVAEYCREIGVRTPVQVINNAVELDAFSPHRISEEQKAAFRARFSVAPDEMVACFVGRLGKEKNVETLLEFWAESVRPEDKFRLVIIGDGPVRGALERQSEQLGISDRVLFAGKVAHEEMPPYFAASDVYVTASLSDTNSISMLEGMATGLPVLQLYDPLNAGQVVDGVNGYNFHDAEEFGRCLRALREKSPDEMKQLRKSVIRSVQSSGAVDLAKKLVAVYESVLKKRTQSVSEAADSAQSLL